MAFVFLLNVIIYMSTFRRKVGLGIEITKQNAFYLILHYCNIKIV